VSSGILALQDMKDYEFFSLESPSTEPCKQSLRRTESCLPRQSRLFRTLSLKVRQSPSIAGRLATIDLRSFEYGRIPLRVNDLRGTTASAGRARNCARLLGVKRPSLIDRQRSLSMQGWCFLSGNRSLGTGMDRSPVLGDVVNRRHLGKVVMNEIEDVFA
jgi:hypothetical protein